MDIQWEHEVAGLLRELTSVQNDLLALLAEKRQHLVRPNPTALQSLQPREQLLIERLQACHDRRAWLLQQAAAEGLPASDLQTLLGSVAPGGAQRMAQQISQAAQKAQLLQHHSLTQWVLVQRSLLHLSQMLEIIATGGHFRPTYGNETPSNATGTLVDQAA